MRKQLILGGLVLVGLGFGYAVATWQAPTHADETAFKAAMADEGWVVVGSFGEAWPARVTGSDEAYGEITFTDAAGQRRTYGGFEGYDLKAVHLRGADGTAFTRVLRSAELTGIVTDGLR